MTNLIAMAMTITNMLMYPDSVFTFGQTTGAYVSVSDTYSNIIHTVTATNEYRPKQYKSIRHLLGYPSTTEERWIDYPEDNYPMWGNQETRDNPDKKIVEVWKHWYIKFNHNGKEYDLEFDKELLDKKVYMRKVETKEEWKFEHE